MSGDSGYILQRGALDPGSGVEHPWGWLNLVSEEATTGIDGVTVGMATIAPGSENPLHIHGNCSEIVLLFSGSVEHVVGDETVELNAGDVLIVPAGVPHQARSVGAISAEMVVVYNSGERGFRLADEPHA
jgi:mannose-6-phosphate isomerase-like protein (cupin superfamily)